MKGRNFGYTTEKCPQRIGYPKIAQFVNQRTTIESGPGVYLVYLIDDSLLQLSHGASFVVGRPQFFRWLGAPPNVETNIAELLRPAIWVGGVEIELKEGEVIEIWRAGSEAVHYVKVAENPSDDTQLESPRRD